MGTRTFFLRPVHAGASHGTLLTFAEFNDQASQLLNFSIGERGGGGRYEGRGERFWDPKITDNFFCVK